MRPLRSINPPLHHLTQRLSSVKATPSCLLTQARHFRPAPRQAAPFQPKINRFARFEELAQQTEVRNPLDYINNQRHFVQRHKALKRRVTLGLLATGLLIAIQVVVIYTADDNASSTERLDAGPNISPALANAEVIVQTKPGQPAIKLDEAGNEYVETGTSTIPHFPKHITLPAAGASQRSPSLPAGISQAIDEEEYTLLGLGVRSVSFLSIQVYVLGLYIRTSDLPTLQAAFIHSISPAGSTLIPDEKATLQSQLLSADGSLAVWDSILRTSRVRSAVRIVPTRSTDFAHLRDGWVRGITARTQEAGKLGMGAEYEDEGFGRAMQEFKAVFGGKGKAPKGSTVVLVRDEAGRMGVLYEAETKKDVTRRGEDGGKLVVPERQFMGEMDDERISRLVWLGYLAGKTVSSEGARKSVVEGVMGLVERPVGSIGMQVV